MASDDGHDDGTRSDEATPVDAEGHVDADAAIVRGDEPPSARVQLDRRRIVDMALEHIEESGLSTLTMRRLGGRLGVEAMSLYHHVPGKEELLDAIVDVLIGDMHADPEVHSTPESRLLY